MASRPSEDDLIARYFRPLAGEGARDLLDDAASIRPPTGCDLVLTTDALVSGVHFFPDDPADAIAWKALAVNLRPRRQRRDTAWLPAFARLAEGLDGGLARDVLRGPQAMCRRQLLPIAGG